MPKIALFEARVEAFKPRRAAYDIRDSKLRGCGVRVLPSGATRFFFPSSIAESASGAPSVTPMR